MKDPNRLQQQEAIGILGVNVLFSAFYLHGSESEFVNSLVENIGPQRIELDIIRLNGPDLTHIKDAILNLELLSLGISNGVLFGPDGSITQASETFYNAPLLVQRGTFRPITNINVDIIKQGIKEFRNDSPEWDQDPLILMEIFMDDNDKNFNDYLKRVEIINSLGYNVLISNLKLFYELREYLYGIAMCSRLSIVMGAPCLDAVFDESYYQDLPGGILSAFGRLFDDNTKLYVFPYKSKMLCTTFRTFNPPKKLISLYKYLLENKMIKDIPGCDDINTSLRSKDIRKMLDTSDPTWETMVPEKAVEFIKEHKLFGYKK